MVKPLLKIRYCFTCDRRLLLEIENTSRSTRQIERDAAVVDNNGIVEEEEDDDDEEGGTAIFSIRCSRPYSFYFRGVEGPTNNCNTCRDNGRADTGRLSGVHDPAPFYSSRETNRSVDSPFVNVGSTEESFSGFSSSSSPTAATPSVSFADDGLSTPPTARESRISRNVQRFSASGEIIQNSSGETDLMRSGDAFEAIQVESIETASDRLWDEGLATGTSLFSFLRLDRPSSKPPALNECRQNVVQFSTPPSPMTPHLRSPHSSLVSNSSSSAFFDIARRRTPRAAPVRPTLVREVIPDGIIHPGETRTFFVDVDDLDDLSRQLRKHPSTPPATFYLYYRSIGPSEKNEKLALEWLEREATLYRKWQTAYIKKVIALEKKKIAETQKSSPKLPVAPSSTMSSVDDALVPPDASGPQRSVDPLTMQKRIPHRIIPPSLGCAVRWGVLTRPKHHPVNELIPFHTFQHFYNTVGGTQREMRHEFGSHLLYEETHSKAVSGSAGKIFEGYYSRSRTAVVPLTSTAVGAGRDSLDSLTPSIGVTPSDHPRLPLSPVPRLISPPQRRIGPGTGLAMLEETPPTPLEFTRHSSTSRGPIHRSTTTLDPAAVEQLHRFTSTPEGPSPSFRSASEDYGPGDSSTSPGCSTPIQRVATAYEVKTPNTKLAPKEPTGGSPPPLAVLQAPRGVLGKTFGSIQRTLKGTKKQDSIAPLHPSHSGSDQNDQEGELQSSIASLCSSLHLNPLLEQFPSVKETLTDVVMPGVVSAGKTIGSTIGEVGSAVGPIAADGIRVAGLPLLVICMAYLLFVMMWGENEDHLDQLLA